MGTSFGEWRGRYSHLELNGTRKQGPQTPSQLTSVKDGSCAKLHFLALIAEGYGQPNENHMKQLESMSNPCKFAFMTIMSTITWETKI